jgi:hypothetical protein
MIPKEPGQYKLGNYFFWVFFNPSKNRYDTLRSGLSVNVRGESRKNEAIESNDLGTFYDKIEIADNTLRSAADTGWEKMAFNIFILVVLSASAYLVFKK